MNISQFKENELKKLGVTVGFKPSVIQSITTNINDYYSEWIEIKKDKKTEKPKRYKDGTVKKRIIRPSKNELKTIQTRIKNRILAEIQLPQLIHGGVKKKSNITNAKPHQGNKYIFTTDLQEFYPNISSRMVYQTFLKLNYSSHYSRWLTKLTTWKCQLPQGTPTSAHIANLVFLETDNQLKEICDKNFITYTRYVDDLTFSSPYDFKHLLKDILEIVTSNNFKISYRKTQYKGNQIITGIEVFLNKIDAPKKIIEKAKLEIEIDSKNKPYNNYRNQIIKTNKK